MKFYFDIDNRDFDSFYNCKDFKDAVVTAAAKSICDGSFDNYDIIFEAVFDEVKRIVREKEEVIVQRVIEVVADKVEKKKSIVAITPKASKLAAADKANEEYFASMIDKAIARRFK